MLDPELIKIKLPPIYAKRTILNSKYQGSPFPAVYMFRDGDVNIYTGYTKNSKYRPESHKEFIEDQCKMMIDGIPYTHIYQIELQSTYVANAIEMLVHNYFPPMIKNRKRNFFRPSSDLENEYNSSGKIKELTLHQLLNYSSMPLLKNLIMEEKQLF